jgi:hypothetical protein
LTIRSPLPSGGELKTLLEAGEFIAALPRWDREKAHWQTATEALILVAEFGGPTMLARIGVLRALKHGRLAPDRPPSRARSYRVIR